MFCGLVNQVGHKEWKLKVQRSSERAASQISHLTFIVEAFPAGLKSIYIKFCFLWL